MANYKLKLGQEQFAVVDGPFEGRRYEPGMVYGEIPPHEAYRFEEIIAEPSPEISATVQKKGKTDKEVEQ